MTDSDCKGRGVADAGGERRSHYRVSDRGIMELTRLTPDQWEDRQTALAAPRVDAFALGSECQALRDQTAVLRRHAARESEAFAKLFDSLERRFDRMVAVLMLHELVPESGEPVSLDISAEGCGFAWPEPLPEGQGLELRLVFPSTGLGLHTLARVARCAHQPQAGDFRVGVRFEFCRDSDQELLVHHVLQREAALLRERQALD